MNHSLSLFAPKRVLLIVKSPKSDQEIVKAFLQHLQRPEEEYEKNTHYIHLDPDRKGRESWSHIVLDMNFATAPDCGLNSMPHEIYKVRSVELEEDL